MKKPTFSKFIFSVFCLFKNFISNKDFYSVSFIMKIRGFLKLVFSFSSVKKQYAFHYFVIALFLLNSGLGYSQVGKVFVPRLPGGNMRIKGDVIFVGNSMVSATTYPNISKNTPDPRNVLPVFSAADPNGTPTNLAALTAEANKNYDILINNNGLNQEYVDIDSDATTFASSSAELNINNTCKRIVYAGLYWTAIYPYERSTNSGSNTVGTPRLNDWNQIKFKVPGAANYVDLVADNAADPVGDEDEIIFDGYKAPPASSFTNSPYVCYKNVTSMLQLLADPNGNYFAANIRAAKGKKSSGSMAGWTLVIVYESPTLPSRFISTFDGYASITSTLGNLDFAVNGFKTLPSPLPVRATIGVAAQEGESKLFGDDLLIKANSVAGFTYVNNSLNPLNNVFNSSITVPTVLTPFSTNVSTRVPNSLNTLGFDMDLINVNNPNNGVIPNNETGATYRLTSTSDTYAVYVTTFAVDVIEPEIVLTKVVKNAAGVNIGNTNVTLGDFLNYEIGFKNVGNDDADSFTIKDILPVNILFDPNNVVVPNGSGITFTYTPATRTIIFNIPNNLVTINGNQWIIKFGVQVVPNCNDLSDACADQVKNQAFGTYKGVTNPTVITDDPSISVFGSCNLATPSATNFLVGLNGCKYTKKYQLCGANVNITAANGYNLYAWSLSPFVNGVPTGPIIGTTQTINVSNVGTYYVHNTAIAPCVSIDETVTVEPFGTTVANPITPFAEETVTCPNDGKLLPNIYLCGDNAKRFIRTGITDANSIIWEKSSCGLTSGTLCADETNGCTWTQIATGPDYNLGGQGQYRITLNYTNGCFSRYFFNVYENTLNPTATSRDIICNTTGQIVVGTPAAASGYEYSLDGVTYQPSNIFSINTPNIYTVYIRSIINLPNRCVFTVPGIQIRRRDFTVTTTVTNPLCYGGKGSIKLAANDVRAQYFYSISKGGIPINSVGPINPNDYTFSNLDPGIYDVVVSTEDGCLYNGTATLIEPAILTATAAITKPLTCESGEITVTPVGGTGPFTYFVNSPTVFGGSPVIAIATPGAYTIRVVDFNNCEYTIAPITVTDNPKPIYTVTSTNVKCYGSSTAEIKFNVTNANGYTLAYSIDDGTTYVNNDTFSNLPIGTYKAILKYSLNGVDCFDAPQTIVITEPAAALTASAGISELAGCGNVLLGIPKNYGKLRITNPQGGVAPYEYSFDNQATWTTVNDAFKAPGTYTLYVRDFNKCIFSASVTLDPEPVEPQIDINTPVDFNCDGTATSTVTVANPGGITYTYDYYLDGTKNTNTPNNVFLNVLPGSHGIKVEYKLNAVPTFSNLLFEDFGKGTFTTSPGINPAYCFEDESTTHLQPGYKCNKDQWINDGEYAVASSIITNFGGAWILNPKDHTTPQDPLGRFLCVNVGGTAGVGGVLYSKPITNVIPNQDVKVSIWALNLIVAGRPTLGDPDLTIELWKDYGLPTAQKQGLSVNTGSIPKSQKWENYNLTINPGNNTDLTFLVRSNSTVINGNDVLIDDINVFQLPKSCITTKDFTIVVPTGKAFTAQISGQKNVTCNGLTNGEITIAAQNFDAIKGFEYSKDNGVTWTTSTTSPVKFTNLGAALYKVVVRPVGSAIAACSKPFDVTISAPAVVTLSASVTKQATCTTGATITAIGGGGTPAYQYELRQSDGTTVVTAYSNNGGIFTNVPSGSYTVFVRDANSCQIPVGVAVPVDAPPTISAAVVPSTAMCFDPTTGAQINVSISGGVAPYSYQTKLNSGTFSASSATFTTTSFTHTAAVTGNYVFRVTDGNGCYFDTAQQVINTKLTANSPVTTDLDCDVAPASPDAVITGTISGGTAPFTVILTSGQTTGTLVGPVGTATTFTYTTGASGTYQFEITDAIGCKTTTSATINAKVAVTGNAVVTNETCETLNNGSVTLQALTGVAPFTYSFNNLGFSGTVTYGSLSGSVAGTSYPYQIRDNKGCIYDGTAVVFEPTLITLTASITTPYTCTTNATITALATNGNGGFTYVLKRTVLAVETTVATNTTGLFPNLTVAGSYTVTTTDAKGCSLTSSPAMVIDALTPPTAMTFTNSLVACPANKTDITIDTYTGGFGAVEYRISAPAAAVTPFQSSATFTNLDPGVTYRFEIRDAKNCLFSTTYSVPVLPTLSASGVVVSNVVCVGESNGSIRYTVGGFGNNTSYSYTIDGVLPASTGTSPATGTTFDILVPSLAAGPHILAITNTTTNCSITASATVAAPSAPLAITAPTISPITCNALTASITINTTGGWGSNTYTVTGPSPATTVVTQSTRTFNNLTAGDYTATVTDANGCIVSTSFTIAAYSNPVVSTTVNGQCTATGSSFQIVATTTGGSGTYTYSINTGVAPTGALLDTFTVAPGTYTITVRDAFGCTDTEVVIVNQVLTAAAVRTKELDCTATPNATIRIDAFGGKPAYNYEVSFNGGLYGAPVAPATIVGNVFTTSVAGTYKFRITDSNLPAACTVETNNVVISPIVYPEIVTLVEKQSIKCHGDATGIIEVTIDPSKGVGPFTYSINGSPYQSSNLFTGLIAGTYTITVKDSKECTFTYPTSIVISQPDPITFVLGKEDITCNNPGGTSLGEIKVLNVLGGTATVATPFRYFITNNFGDIIAGNPYTASTTGRENYTFTVINFGVYTVNVVDANGCSLSKQITIASPPSDLSIDVTTLSSNCTTGGTAIVKAISTVGSGNYEFGILETNTSPYTTTWYTPDVPGVDTRTFTNLTPGVTYTFVVHDLTTLCYYVKSADQPIAPASTLTSTVTPKNVTCKGNKDGKVTFTIDDFDATTTSIDYQLFYAYSNAPVGPFFNVSVTFGTPVTITDFSPMAATLEPGSYYIRFIENGTGAFNLCKSASAIFEIKESSVDLSISASVIKNDNCNIDAGQIVAVARGGTVIAEDLAALPPITAVPYLYQVLVDNGPIGQDGSDTAPTAASFNIASHSANTFYKEADNYLVYVRDAYGCIKVAPVTVLLDPIPVIDLSNVANCAVEGAFSLDVDLTSPGIGPYTISVNGGTFQNVASFPYTVTGLSSGPQSIIVRDTNGCPSNTSAVTLHKKLSVLAEVTKELDCTTSPDGLITVTVSDGLFTSSDLTPDFRYEVSINGAPYLASVNFGNDTRIFTYPVSTSGTYQFRITDLNNCTVESTVVDIAAKVNPTATAAVTQPTCVGLADGSIKITATGGVLPYEYSTDGGTTWQDSNEFTGLPAGPGNYIVRDAKKCLFNGSEPIINPTPVVAALDSVSAFTCSPTNTPNITVVTVSAAGGSGTYTFSSDGINYFPSNSIPIDNKYAFDVIDTSVSSVTFYTKDVNGCIDDIVVPIAAFPKLVSAVASLGTPIDCLNNKQEMNVVINGGTNTPNPFTYNVYQDGLLIQGPTPVVGTTFTYDALVVGSFYEFEIIDNNTTCRIKSNALTVPNYNTMTLTASAAANVDCATNATGAIEINIGNYTGAYTYEVFNGATSVYTNSHNTTASNPFVIPFGLVAGNDYTVVVTQTAYPSCPGTSNVVIITEPAALDLTGLMVNVKNQNCNTLGAVLTVDDTTIVGGTRGFEFAFVPTTTSPIGFYSPSKTKTIATSATAVSPDLIDVYVKDANGCFRFVTVPISLDPVPTVTASAASQCPSPTGYAIIAAGAGGVGALEYSLDGNSFQSSNSLTVTAPGNYTIWVRDANGCINQTLVPVTIFEPIQLQADVTTLSTCLNADGVVTLTASGGSAIPANYEYSNDSITYVSSNVFGGLAASATPYTFFVRDIATVPACVKPVSVTMLLPNTAIDFVLDTTPVTCEGGSDGTITANMTPSTLTVNNNPIYSYALTGTTVGGVSVAIPLTGTQPSPLFSGLEAGSYTVTVTSGRLCSVSQTIDVSQPAQIIVPAPTVLEFGCTSGNAGNLATITVDPTLVTGGSGTYLNYEFIKVGTPNTVVQFGNSNVYTEANLSGGSYVVNVYDSKGCIGTTTAPIIIAPYIQLDKVNVNVTNAITCTNLETIEVSVTSIGGAPSNLAFAVQDVTYDNSVPPIATKGTAYNLPPVSVVGGVATFTNLPVGNYEITVRNLDTNCEIIGVHYVNEPNTFDLTIDNVVDVTCFTDANGSARVTLIDRVPTPMDNAGPFDYTVFDIANPLAPVVVVPTTNSPTPGPITLTGLRAGTFMITASLSGTPFCTVSKNFTITGPTAALTALETHSVITCVAVDSGSISASATGGWPGGYEFELVGPVAVAYSTVSNFTNLTAGTYTVNVRDTKGCVASVVVPLNNPTPIAFTATPSTLLLTCNGDTSASITVGVPTGGQGSNYLYTLNRTSLVPVVSSGPQISNIFTNLEAGAYTVTVTDGWGCGTTSAVMTIAQPNVVVASLVKASTNTCNVQATVTLSATGGTGLYTYSTTPNFAVIAGSFATSITFPIAVGVYRYYVRDANGCRSVVSNDIQIDALPTLNVAVDIVNSKINCKGDFTGVIIATATGGLGNYVYTLLNGSGLPLAFTPTQVTPGNFTQLPAGTYVVRVNSGDCVANSIVITIAEPAVALNYTFSKTDVKCAGNGDGTITVNGFDGTGIIKYAITPRSDKFLDTGLFTNLKPGLYTVIIQDQNGCYLLQDVTITEPLPIDAKVDPLSIKQELCAGEKTGEFAVLITAGSGTAPYSTSIDNPNGTYVLNQVLFTGLSGGNHTVYIKDANSCTFELPVALDPSVTLNPVATISTECVNDLPANKVTVTVDSSNNLADVKYYLDASTTENGSNVFNNLTPGDHYIMVHHKNGCIDATPVFPIEKIDPLAITLDLGGLNEIVATVTGGSKVYQFTVNGVSNGSNTKYIYFKSGNYTVTVTDTNGCVAAATKYFEFIDIVIPPIFTPTGDGTNETWKPTNTENYPDIKFIVYDRYGRVVGTFGAGQSWDGNYNGTELPMGDYWYVLKLRHNQDDREFMGHFTLYR
ncbi:Gliding motility-associated, C-terminal domain [Flavobacteriaceae bacterium]